MLAAALDVEDRAEAQRRAGARRVVERAHRRLAVGDLRAVDRRGLAGLEVDIALDDERARRGDAEEQERQAGVDEVAAVAPAVVGDQARGGQRPGLAGAAPALARALHQLAGDHGEYE